MQKVFSKLPYALGFVALLLLLAKLPGVAAVLPFFYCSECLEETALIAMLGGGYFAGLISLFYLVPSFPSRLFAFVGVLWALSLTATLTMLVPAFCIICFLAHLCHVGMWLCFVFFPRAGGLFGLFFVKKLLSALLIGFLVFLAYFFLNESLLYHV